MQKILLHEIYGNIISTVIALIVIVLASLLIDIIFARKIESNRLKRQFRIRSFYIGCFVCIFLMARIWVEGFTHLLAVLGLVSAALVVSNKETIMNFVGWIVINWRGLFSEDDLIQILHYKGYVKSFGVLYFTIAETSEGRNGNITGRVIRIPNGLIANNPLVNFSQTSHLLEQTFKIILLQTCDHEYAIKLLTKLVNDVISEFYRGKKEYSMEYLKKHHKYLSERIHLDARVTIQLKLDKPTGVELTTHFYCFCKDGEMIQQKIWSALLNALKDDEEIKLSYTI